MRSLRALKILVIVMGAMLVVGFAALIVAIAGKVSHRRTESTGHRPPAAAPIDIPRGARLEAMTTAPDRLILDFVMPEGERQIVVIDLTTGARVGLIELRPAPGVAKPPASAGANTGAP
jgi:Family of unknown function (DUF6476)